MDRFLKYVGHKNYIEFYKYFKKHIESYKNQDYKWWYDEKYYSLEEIKDLADKEKHTIEFNKKIKKI